MRRWLAVLLSLLCLFFPAAARAQDAIRIDRWQVDIWPEYDRAGVLVINRITLAPETPIPAELTLRIPLAAGSPFTLAMQDVDGMLYNLDYTSRIAGEWAIISFTTPSLQVQLEYYDPGLEMNGMQRFFTYTWPGDYPVSSMTVQVQRPIATTEMYIYPSLGSGRTGWDGLTYYTAVIGSMAAGLPFDIEITYTKTDDTLSSSLRPVQPSEPITLQTAGRIAPVTAVPWALAFLGLLLVGGAGVWYWRSGRAAVRRFAPLRPRLPKNPPVPLAAYCHQCGKRAQPGDIFCRACGAKLRIE